MPRGSFGGGPGGPMMPPIGGFGGPGRRRREMENASGGHRREDPKVELDLEELEKQSQEMMTLQFMTKETAVFTETPGGFLSLSFHGQTWERIDIVRTFPFSDKNSFLSIREHTERAKEIGIIRSLEKDFDPQTVAILNKQLDLHYFTPRIEKIYTIKERSGFIYFHVLTEKGKKQFTVRNNSNAIIPFTESRIFITDIDNNRYEIPDTALLQPKELAKLDLFL